MHVRFADSPTPDPSPSPPVEDPDGDVFESLDIFASTAFEVIVTIIVGLVVIWLLRAAIRRFTRRLEKVPSRRPSAQDSASRAVIERRSQRIKTLNSVMQSAVAIVFGIVLLFMVLVQLGVDIAPLLASAGVAGVALGFGAQSLVKDILSGVFLMLEDQYGVGDFVKLGEIEGTVEDVGLRTTRLRDDSGTLWYIRNGEILSVGNETQGWSRAVVDIKVGLGEDIDRVQALVQDLITELAQEREFSESILGQAQTGQVAELAAGGVLLRITVKTTPGRHWAVASELRRRIGAAFTRAGIALVE